MSQANQIEYDEGSGWPPVRLPYRGPVVDVGEEVTVAAAATAIMMKPTAVHVVSGQVDFTADQPVRVAVIHDSTVEYRSSKPSSLTLRRRFASRRDPMQDVEKELDQPFQND